MVNVRSVIKELVLSKLVHTLIGISTIVVGAMLMTMAVEEAVAQVVLFRLAGLLFFVLGIYYLQQKAGFGNRHKKS